MENSIQNISKFTEKLKILFQNNYLLTAILGAVCLLFLSVILFANFSPTINTSRKVSPTILVPTQAFQPTTTLPSPSSYVHEEKTAIEEEPVSFVESADFTSEGQKETLNDGSIKYTMTSLNPKRSDILLMKNNTIILMRYTVVGKDVSDGYKNLLGKQSNIFPGPTFYGSNTVIYFYEKGGTALIVDPKTQTTYEEFTFQPPISAKDFLEKYREYAN